MNADATATEHPLFRKTVREAFADLFPTSRVRELMATDTGWDVVAWRRLAGELGLPGIAVDERLGGSGWSVRELGVVFEEAGRSLACTPLFAVAGLAIPLLAALGDAAACERWLPALCEGTLTATVVTADRHGRYGPSRVEVRADGDSLNGRGGYVVDGATADLFLIPAQTPDGREVYVVRRDDPGVRVAPLISLDQTRKQAHVDLDGAPATRLLADDVTGALERAFATSCALLACELVGVAQRCLDMTAAHAKTRIQFGRPIGSFQAVKQKLADMLIHVESARSAAGAAVAAAASASVDASWTASLAKAYCSQAAMAVAAETIQLHGGIGFTWEHDAHLYFKRARASEEMLGTAQEHYDRVGEHLAEL